MKWSILTFTFVAFLIQQSDAKVDHPQQNIGRLNCSLVLSAPCCQCDTGVSLEFVELGETTKSLMSIMEKLLRQNTAPGVAVRGDLKSYGNKRHSLRRRRSAALSREFMEKMRDIRDNIDAMLKMHSRSEITTLNRRILVLEEGMREQDLKLKGQDHRLDEQDYRLDNQSIRLVEAEKIATLQRRILELEEGMGGLVLKLKGQCRRLDEQDLRLDNQSSRLVEAEKIATLQRKILVLEEGMREQDLKLKGQGRRLDEQDQRLDIQSSRLMETEKIATLQRKILVLEKGMREQDLKLKGQGHRLDEQDYRLDNQSSRLIETEKQYKFRFIDLVAEGIGFDDIVKLPHGRCTRYCKYRPEIKKNGRRIHSVTRRGYTFVVFDGKTGQETSFRRFDVYGNNSLDDAVVAFYNSIPTRSIVVVATYDEPKRGATKTLNVLKSLGVNVSFGTRDGFAMIGCKGSIPSWLVWQHVPRGQGLARVQARVPLLN